jgi:uncharacterized protein YbjT (DUF2867 family)
VEGQERGAFSTPRRAVREEYGPTIPEHRAKLAAERAIEASGFPYMFWRPTYVTNTLPRHAQGPMLVALGRQRRALHPVCAKDFAPRVARAFETEANQLLGAPTTTVEQWCRAQASASDAHGGW